MGAHQPQVQGLREGFSPPVDGACVEPLGRGAIQEAARSRKAIPHSVVIPNSRRDQAAARRDSLLHSPCQNQKFCEFHHTMNLTDALTSFQPMACKPPTPTRRSCGNNVLGSKYQRWEISSQWPLASGQLRERTASDE